jgi:hypothetical protein
MVLDQAAPLLFASAAAIVFVLVLGVVLASDLTSPTGSSPIGTTLFIGVVGSVIWATFFFILAYIPLALVALSCGHDDPDSERHVCSAARS